MGDVACNLPRANTQWWIHGDRSIATKLASGDKISLLVMGDSRLNYHEWYWSQYWTTLPIAGASFSPYVIAGVVGAPWTSTASYPAAAATTASAVLPGTNIGEFAQFDLAEVAFADGVAPAVDGDGGGTPSETSSALLYNNYLFTSYSWALATSPRAYARMNAVFAAHSADVRLCCLTYDTPTGVSTADLHLQFRSDPTNYTTSGPGYAASAGFDAYAATPGYSLHTLATPNVWATYGTPAFEVIYTRGGTTRAGETLVVPRLWLECATYGITMHNFSVGGRSLIDTLTVDDLFPLGQFGVLAAALPGEVILWLDLGTNDATQYGPTVAQHKARIAELVTLFRAGVPNGRVLLTTAYPRSTDTPATRPNYAEAAVQFATESAGVLCIDTHLMMQTYLAGVAHGDYQDAIHYKLFASTAGGNERYACVIEDLIVRAAA